MLDEIKFWRVITRRVRDIRLEEPQSIVCSYEIRFFFLENARKYLNKVGLFPANRSYSGFY